MDAARMVIPAAAAIAMFASLFGVVMARVVWSEEAKRADLQVKRAEEIRAKYEKIYDIQNGTIASQNRIISSLEAHIRLSEGGKP
jgi:hypothetical protein